MQTTPFVITDTGSRLVQVLAIMHPLIPYVDGLNLVYFKGDKKPYLKIEDAIEWVDAELKLLKPSREGERSKYQKMLEVLKRFRDQEETNIAVVE